MIKKITSVSKAGGGRELRIGFLPLKDAAPLVIAHELGIFEKWGLCVSLHRELGWATMRDKMIYGELEAAHALAAMPLAATLGLGSIRCDCITALVLSLNGNAITLSEALWKQGVRDGNTLRSELIRRRHEKIFTFGVVHRFSSHCGLFSKWLTSSGIDPKADVRLVVLPPSLMVNNLISGNIDGFCAGEPWNSVAIRAGAGWCVETSAAIDPDHPEKVLMVRRDFAERRENEHLRLVAALLEGCEFCEEPANAELVARILARPEYVDVAPPALLAASGAPFDFGHSEFRRVPRFQVFHGDGANEPTAARAAWALDLIRATGACREPSALNLALGRRVFRTDLFARAQQLRLSSHVTRENEKAHEKICELA